MKKTEYNLHQTIINNDFELFKKHFINKGISLDNLNYIVKNHKNEMFNFVVQKKDFRQYYDKLFNKAIEYRNIPICKTILDAETIKPKNKKKTKNRFADILNNYLRIQCEQNNLDNLKLFMTSILSENINMYSSDNYGRNLLISAIKERNVDVVRFLLFSPELKENFKLNGYTEFNFAVGWLDDNYYNYKNIENLKEKSLEIVHCFLYEAELEITEKYYEKHKDFYGNIHLLVKKLVEKRDLFMKLDYNLYSSYSKTKRMKI